MSDNPPSTETQAKKPAGIDWLSTTAGALAAVTSALLLSTLGAVGTLVGAAIGSVAATIGSNLYSQWLAKTHQKVTSVQALARWRSAGLAGVRNEGASQPAADAGDGTTAIEATEITAEPTPSWRERLESLPWKRISLLSLAMFVVVVAVITVFELMAGRSVSSIVGNGDGGTTISRVTGGGSDARDEGPAKDPSGGATATPEESASTTTEPSAEEPQESESPATGEPSADPSTSTGPSATPSEQPSESASTSSGPSPTTGASSAPADQATP
ncbi:hypothetical protein ACFVJS_23935 [Nocardioides sp. NPDC057772]|uniref:hypothetical protein n=1 Tax=Nocardioides sp. NPDC057772 TaxID=3346245 RepID=UPI0036735203